jgi:Transcriptional regulator, AbiEi antitoxin, Type IV TA system/Transcriptional regulator, AbiEi antitoxin N-terminal domain
MSKINSLLSSNPPGIVLESFWLKCQGYSHELQSRYKKSKWLESIGSGAMVRYGEKVSYEGGIYALQNQSGMTIHPGGKTALEFLGLSQYLEFSSKNVTVFGRKNEQLPTWFKKHDWGIRVDYYKTSFLAEGIDLATHELKNFSIKISTAPQAIMECLYLAPEKQELMECYHFMESMNNARPVIIQKLLENCGSIKVKRLFLYLAEKAGHEWFKLLNLENVDLGKGKRSITKNGVLNSKYKIVIPRELESYDKGRI